MTSPSAARADGEDWLKRSEARLDPGLAGSSYIGLQAELKEARRVVTALLEALRETGSKRAQSQHETIAPSEAEAATGQSAISPSFRTESLTTPPTAARPEISPELYEQMLKSARGGIVGDPFTAGKELVDLRLEVIALKAARPLASSLTQERLARLLEDLDVRDLTAGPAHHLTYMQAAAWLLPHLAGPAQEGPQ